jgi:hypothetical protein
VPTGRGAARPRRLGAERRNQDRRPRASTRARHRRGARSGRWRPPPQSARGDQRLRPAGSAAQCLERLPPRPPGWSRRSRFRTVFPTANRARCRCGCSEQRRGLPRADNVRVGAVGRGGTGDASSPVRDVNQPVRHQPVRLVSSITKPRNAAPAAKHAPNAVSATSPPTLASATLVRRGATGYKVPRCRARDARGGVALWWAMDTSSLLGRTELLLRSASGRQS